MKPSRAAAAFLAFVLALAVGSADAQQQRRPGAPSKGKDADQPIEITADNLEVQQDKQLAIFKGRVQAIQGSMRLVADSVSVTYRADKAAPTPPGQARPAGPAEGAIGAISRIDAVGNVFISSAAETAEGRTGVYDVDKRTITLTGSVVLTRDKNVLRGETLVWNLDTGVTRLDGGATTTTGAPGGRVKGIFVPQGRSP